MTLVVVHIPEGGSPPWCSHRLLVDEEGWRRCLTCGVGRSIDGMRRRWENVLNKRYPPLKNPWSVYERTSPVSVDSPDEELIEELLELDGLSDWEIEFSEGLRAPLTEGQRAKAEEILEERRR